MSTFTMADPTEDPLHHTLTWNLWAGHAPNRWGASFFLLLVEE